MEATHATGSAFISLHVTCSVYITYGLKATGRWSVIFLDCTLGSYPLSWCTNSWKFSMLWPKIKNPFNNLQFQNKKWCFSEQMLGMPPMYLKRFFFVFIASVFKISCMWEELKRKLIQNKKETERLTFKTEFVLIYQNKLFLHVAQSSFACTEYI